MSLKPVQSRNVLHSATRSLTRFCRRCANSSSGSSPSLSKEGTDNGASQGSLSSLFFCCTLRGSSGVQILATMTLPVGPCFSDDQDRECPARGRYEPLRTPVQTERAHAVFLGLDMSQPRVRQHRSALRPAFCLYRVSDIPKPDLKSASQIRACT